MVVPDIKFDECHFGGKRVVPCWRTYGQTHKQPDITKLIVFFRNSRTPKTEVKVFPCSKRQFLRIIYCIV